MLNKKYHYSCDLCPSNMIDVFSEEIHEISNDEITNFSKLMNDAISKKSQTGSAMKDEDLFVIKNQTLINLSIKNSMNLEYFVVVNSRKLLEASYRFATNDKHKNHLDYCHYLLLFVRCMHYNNNHSIKPNNDKMLIGLSLNDTCMKHKGDKSLGVFSKHFRQLTNYDGTTNINPLTIWFYWMVDNMTLSIAVMDTKTRSVMLCVPKYEFKLSETINATLKDIDKMIECSLEGHWFSPCEIKEASNNNAILDCELHKANHIIYVSLEMICNNKFSIESFCSIKNNMECDHLLVRRCMFKIICFSVLGSITSNSTLSMFERNPMLKSIQSNQMNSINVSEKLDQFTLLCAEIEKNAHDQTLCQRIELIVNAMLVLGSHNNPHIDIKGGKISVQDIMKRFKKHCLSKLVIAKNMQACYEGTDDFIKLTQELMSKVKTKHHQDNNIDMHSTLLLRLRVKVASCFRDNTKVKCARAVNNCVKEDGYDRIVKIMNDELNGLSLKFDNKVLQLKKPLRTNIKIAVNTFLCYSMVIKEVPLEPKDKRQMDQFFNAHSKIANEEINVVVTKILETCNSCNFSSYVNSQVIENIFHSSLNANAISTKDCLIEAVAD